MSPRNVTEGAKCECSLGMSEATLGFPSCKTVQLRGSMGLSVLDQRFVVNFGGCYREEAKCMPCTPTPDGPWSSEAPKVWVGGAPALVETAKMRCALGGEITITDPGPANTYSGDELFVGADGQAIIARGTHEEVEKMKRAEGIKEWQDRADEYLNNPFLSGLEAVAETFIDSKKSKDLLRPPGYRRRRKGRGRGKGRR